VFLVVGACDWLTRGWLDGEALGEHRGGYTPFEFELTSGVKWGQEQQLVLRVDDTKHPFKLEGKQGYGEKGTGRPSILRPGRAYLAALQFGSPASSQGDATPHHGTSQHELRLGFSGNRPTDAPCLRHARGHSTALLGAAVVAR
jgi:hypothetical protein